MKVYIQNLKLGKYRGLIDDEIYEVIKITKEDVIYRTKNKTNSLNIDLFKRLQLKEEK